VKRRSAGVVVVRPGADGPRFLLLRCYRYWDFPKGEIELGEDPIDAARREVREETEIGDLHFRWGETFTETPPYAGGKIARYYLGESASGPVSLPVNPQLGRPEHDEYRWASRAEAASLLNERLRAVLDWADHQLAAGPQPGPTAESEPPRATDVP
jgi:bis(5'-nucleosidyl)-tetraphosphatase